MKLILVVLDGLADRPVPELDNKTPLEAADTPALDFIARKGSSGMIDVLGGIAPESDSAVLSILGYDPYKYYTGRGPLEAVGIGSMMKKGMLALRCNFATTSNGTDLVDRRVARSLTSREAEIIARAINKSIKLKDARFIFKASVAHRAVLIIKSKNPLSARITNTDPAYSVSKSGIPEALHGFEMKVQRSMQIEKGKSAKLAADLLNEFTEASFEVLNDHPLNLARRKKGLLPANIIISRDAGDRLPPLFNISKRYKRRFAILADMPLEVGIGKLSGMRVMKLPLPTFGKNDFFIRVKAAVSALKNNDCLYVHIKGPDLFGHEGDFNGKKGCIEAIDRYFFSPLLKKIDLKNTVIAVTADHSTPCEMKGHSGDPVPFILAGGSIKPDYVASFSERKCSSGSYGLVKATDFMSLLMKNS